MTARARPSLLLIVCIGALLAVATVLLGAVRERWRLGPGDDDALARVEAELRRDIDGRVRQLRDIGAALTKDGDLSRLLQEANVNRPALFAVLEAVRIADDISVSVYAPTGAPLAWSGRPSDVPVSRLSSTRELFVALGALGWRLVLVEPVLAPADGSTGPTRRQGSLVIEYRLTPPLGVDRPPGTSFDMSTSLGPVTLYPPRFVTGDDERPRLGFTVTGLGGDPLVEARVASETLVNARREWRQRVRAMATWLLALTLLIGMAVLVERRWRQTGAGGRLRLTTGAVALLGAARLVAWLAPTEPWRAWSLFATGTYGTADAPWLLRTPFDFCLSAVSLTTALVITFGAVRPLRAWAHGRRIAAGRRAAALLFLVAQFVAGAVAGGIVALPYGLIKTIVEVPRLSVLVFGLWPADGARLGTLAGLVAVQMAAVWSAVAVLRLATVPFRLDHTAWAARWRAPALWVAGGALVAVSRDWLVSSPPVWPFAWAMGAAIAIALLTRKALGWYRHGSQVRRLVMAFVAFWLPALLLYPGLRHFADSAKRSLIQDVYAEQVNNHPQELQRRLTRTMGQIDELLRRDVLEPLVAPPGAVPTGPAFALWRQTELADARLTSAVELYTTSGRLVSRFALNFPEYDVTAQRWVVRACEWEVFGETTAFGSSERRMLHAERALCLDDPATAATERRVAGAIVVHVMLDYPALPFISDRDPYSELFQASDSPRREVSGNDTMLVVYGWGRTPIYSSAERAWPLTDEVFARLQEDAAREPFWTRLPLGDVTYDVHFTNDRQGIYALGYPTRTVFDAFVDLGELTTLLVAFFAALLVAALIVATLGGGAPLPGRNLVREIRTSFYRKLFLAFVAVAVVPVFVLALLIRTSVAARLRADVEAEAVRTSTVAQRVIEESITTQPGSSATLTDDAMVWISRVIEQDVTIYDGAELLATSERDLFTSGLLPTRAPSAVFKAIVIDRLPNFVGEDRIADFRYLTAATPIRYGNRDLILTVPLALRQREIEQKIDDLDRGVNLAVLVFIGLAAAIGYWMAERIGDPVQRLTRATRRIASGDLDARVMVKSADELERLVADFNRMAEELKRQRSQLERTNRLEAWAEMARQVAHDIKNPLTPIQLSAEHLRRVNRDKGAPLNPVLDACVDTILTQVRLLRQLSSEFSAFASSPTPRLSREVVADLVAEVVKPYEQTLEGRVRFDVVMDPALPLVSVDRTLLGRALTNIIDNALHAMPNGGTLAVHGAPADAGVTITVSDTGVGMDAAAVSRIFEPYFSTKATGTGLGLTIAKRNIELHGGTIAVRSQLDEGTTVTVTLPVDVA